VCFLTRQSIISSIHPSIQNGSSRFRTFKFQSRWPRHARRHHGIFQKRQHHEFGGRFGLWGLVGGFWNLDYPRRILSRPRLGVAMGSRLLSTGKSMPAGMVATLGILGCAYNVKKALEWMPEEKAGVYYTYRRHYCYYSLRPIDWLTLGHWCHNGR
jgi:hypothetical protein